jgi:DNA-binding transcriptional regulator YiaG
MKKKYQSEILMVCHQEAEALYEIGAIDAARMKEFDEMCLSSEPDVKAGNIQRPSTPAFANPRQS